MYGRAQEILSDIESKHFDTAEWALRETEAVDVASDQYCAVVSFLLLVEACEFERRVGSIVFTFPSRMCWFVKSEPNIDCSHRRATSDRLLSTPTKHLDSTSAKVKYLMRAELEEMRDTGKMDTNLHACFNGCFGNATISIQSIESTNNTICHI